MSNLQFNLLPDVKMDYVKAARTKNTVISISIIVSAISLGIFLVLLFSVSVVQKKQIKDLDKELISYTNQLKQVPNVDRIVTVQNQLKSLVGLHQNKHISSRIFGYLSQLTPSKAGISEVNIDFTTNTIEISGTADSHQTINKYIDTLKFTKYTVNNEDTPLKAFPTVVEKSFTLNNLGSKADYTITATFDPVLFSNDLQGATPKLKVPSQTSTRSVIDDPANTLFNGSIKPTNTQEGTQ